MSGLQARSSAWAPWRRPCRVCTNHRYATAAPAAEASSKTGSKQDKQERGARHVLNPYVDTESLDQTLEDHRKANLARRIRFMAAPPDPNFVRPAVVEKPPPDLEIRRGRLTHEPAPAARVPFRANAIRFIAVQGLLPSKSQARLAEKRAGGGSRSKGSGSKRSGPKESKPQDPDSKGSRPKESRPKESRLKESRPKESKPQDPESNESTPNESTPKWSMTKKSWPSSKAWEPNQAQFYGLGSKLRRQAQRQRYIQERSIRISPDVAEVALENGNGSPSREQLLKELQTQQSLFSAIKFDLDRSGEKASDVSLDLLEYTPRSIGLPENPPGLQLSQEPWKVERAGSALERLEAQITAFTSYLQPTDVEAQGRRRVSLAVIKLIRSHACRHNVKLGVELYGSTRFGIDLPTSDMDFRVVCAQPPGETPTGVLSNAAYVSRALPALRGEFARSSHFADVKMVYGRHTLIQAIHVPSGLTVQIVDAPSVPKYLVTHALASDPTLRPRYFFLKASLDARGLLTPFNGHLSSWALLNMIITSDHAAQDMAEAIDRDIPIDDAQNLKKRACFPSLWQTHTIPSSGRLALKLLDFLYFWSYFDTYRFKVMAADGGRLFRAKDPKFPAHPTFRAKWAPPLENTLVRLIATQDNFAAQPYLLHLADIANPKNDLGQRANLWKHTQETLLGLWSELSLALNLPDFVRALSHNDLGVTKDNEDSRSTRTLRQDIDNYNAEYLWLSKRHAQLGAELEGLQEAGDRQDRQIAPDQPQPTPAALKSELDDVAERKSSVWRKMHDAFDTWRRQARKIGDEAAADDRRLDDSYGMDQRRMLDEIFDSRDELPHGWNLIEPFVGRPDVAQTAARERLTAYSSGKLSKKEMRTVTAAPAPVEEEVGLVQEDVDFVEEDVDFVEKDVETVDEHAELAPEQEEVEQEQISTDFPFKTFAEILAESEKKDGLPSTEVHAGSRGVPGDILEPTGESVSTGMTLADALRGQVLSTDAHAERGDVLEEPAGTSGPVHGDGAPSAAVLAETQPSLKEGVVAEEPADAAPTALAADNAPSDPASGIPPVPAAAEGGEMAVTEEAVDAADAPEKTAAGPAAVDAPDDLSAGPAADDGADDMATEEERLDREAGAPRADGAEAEEVGDGAAKDDESGQRR